MLLKAEKDLGNVKVLAITTVIGNTTMDNVIKNTYRILDGLNRTDVRQMPLLPFSKCPMISNCLKKNACIDSDLQRRI